MGRDEIDLRPLVLAILRNWLLLVVGIGLALVASWLWYGNEIIYKAEAQVAIVKVQATADFESGIKREEAIPDQAALGSALVSLAISDDVVQGIIERLGTNLPDDLREVRSLGSRLRAGIDARNGLIKLNFYYHNTQLTVDVVNAWADAFVTQANEVYGGGNGEPMLRLAQQQYDTARQRYEQSEKTLADFIVTDMSPTLEQRVAEYQTAVDNLRAVRTTIISQTAAVDVAKITQVISSYAELRWSGQSAVIDEQVRQQVETLQNAYTTLRRLELLRQDAIALRDHLAAGGDSESSGLALQLLKSQAFAGADVVPANLQVQISLTGKASVTDVETILGTIDKRIVALKADISKQAAALLDGKAFDLPDLETISGNAGDSGLQNQAAAILSSRLLLQQLVHGGTLTQTERIALAPDDTIVQLQQQLQQLQAQMHQLKAKRFILEQERDHAERTYISVGLKLSELASVNTTADRQVIRTASKALQPTKQGVSTLLSKMSITTAAVFMLLVLIILIREFVPRWLTPIPQQPAAIESTRAEQHR